MSTAFRWLNPLPIERRALAAITHHRYDHQPEEPAVTPLAKLIEDIEHDVTAAGVNLHDALTHHLTLVNVLGHAADAAAWLAANPLVKVVEDAAGLPPEAQGIIARMAGGLAAELSHQAQLQPLPAPAAPETAATA